MLGKGLKRVFEQSSLFVALRKLREVAKLELYVAIFLLRMLSNIVMYGLYGLFVLCFFLHLFLTSHRVLPLRYKLTL